MPTTEAGPEPHSGRAQPTQTALKMEEAEKGKQLREDGKDKAMDSALQPPEGMQTCGRLDSSPTKPILDSVLQNAKTINV